MGGNALRLGRVHADKMCVGRRRVLSGAVVATEKDSEVRKTGGGSLPVNNGGRAPQVPSFCLFRVRGGGERDQGVRRTVISLRRQQ